MFGKYLNLTPHDVTFVVGDDTKITIGASGHEMRLRALPAVTRAVASIEGDGPRRDFIWMALVAPRVYDGLEWDRDALLEEFSRPDLTIIVSELVGRYLMERPQDGTEFRHCRVVSPDTNPDSAVRVDGQIIGVRQFVNWEF